MIRELLALADASGSATAKLESEREAELFRFAIYNFRKSADVGLDLIITLDGESVIVSKPAPARVEIAT